MNEQKLGIFHEMNLTDVRLSVDFPVYSAGADLNLTGIRDDFQKALEFGRSICALLFLFLGIS